MKTHKTDDDISAWDRLIDDLFALDKEHEFIGQTIEGDPGDDDEVSLDDRSAEDRSDAARKAWDARGRKDKDGVRDKAASGDRPTPIRAKSIKEAVDLILDGQVVEVEDTRTVHTVLSKLAKMAEEAKALGAKAPTYDLCQVSVANSNLFCGSKLRTEAFPNGVPRLQMPQMSGAPVPGSPADKLPKKPSGNVDGAQAFVRHLTNLGISAREGSIPASRLKASQAELNGPKVASMIVSSNYDPARDPIFVSRDNYVVDGHHRWAAVVGKDAADNRLGDLRMKVVQLDAPISEILHIATKWSKSFGIYSKSARQLSYRAHLAMLLDDRSAEDRSDAARRAWDVRGRKEDSDEGGRDRDLSKAPRIPKLSLPDDARERAAERVRNGDTDGAIKAAGVEFEHALKEIVARQPKAQSELSNTIAKVVDQFGGDVTNADLSKSDLPEFDKPGVYGGMGPPKSVKRMVEKAIIEEGGDLSRISDPVRSTIMVDSPDQVHDVVDAIKKVAVVEREKDRFSNPTAGYRDYMLKVRMSNGLEGEIQIHLKSMLKAKNGMGHKIYEQMRSLIGDRSPSSRQRLMQLTAESVAFYSSVWVAMTGGGGS